MAFAEAFLVALRNRCFLTTPTISELLLRVLATCRRFAAFHSRECSALVRSALQTSAQLDQLATTWWSELRQFYTALSSGPVGLSGDEHVQRLLVRLDFSGWYSRHLCAGAGTGASDGRRAAERADADDA